VIQLDLTTSREKGRLPAHVCRVLQTSAEDGVFRCDVHATKQLDEHAPGAGFPRQQGGESPVRIRHPRERLDEHFGHVIREVTALAAVGSQLPKATDLVLLRTQWGDVQGKDAEEPIKHRGVLPGQVKRGGHVEEEFFRLSSAGLFSHGIPGVQR